MDFAPYQDHSPETTRALSPPPDPPPPRRSPTHSPTPHNNLLHGPSLLQQPPSSSPPPTNLLLEPPITPTTRLEAVLAYLLLPPAGGVLLLLVEHRSDYVRFHAWQSALVFSVAFVVHLVFSWSRAVSYTLLAADLLLIAWLARRAWCDADTLDRCELPFFGPLASSILDDE